MTIIMKPISIANDNENINVCEMTTMKKKTNVSERRKKIY